MIETPPEQARPDGGSTGPSIGASENRLAFFEALVAGWVVLGVAGVLYGRMKAIPDWAADPLLAAFLAEYSFYLVLAFPTLRERMAGSYLPAYLTFSAVLPYLISCMGASRFTWTGLACCAALALVLSLWHRILPATPVLDVVFLALIPAALLGRYFQAVFIPLVPQLRNEFAFLGHFILIQMAIAVLLLGRRVPDPGFGFIPAWREWRIGVVHYLWFAVLGLPLALLMKAVHLRAAPAPAWSVLGTLVGYLWVVALSEEFFFRGVLQQWIGNWTRSASRALLITSVLFGLIHLGYRRFPNWRWVLVATLLGWCCGRARNQAGNIRAAVVTHALAVATWRGFFS